MNSRLIPYMLSAPAGALLLAVLVGPVVLLCRVSLYEPPQGRGFFAPGTWTLTNYATALDSDGLGILTFTLLFGCGVAVVSVIVSYPLALYIQRLSAHWQRIAIGAVFLPKMASILVILFGLQQILSASGPISGLLVTLGLVSEPITLSRSVLAAALGEVYLIVPYTVLIILLQLVRIDSSLELAARGLGGSRWQVFGRVTLPLSIPGVILAGQLGLMWGMGAFLGPMLLGTPQQTTVSVEIHRQAFEYGRWPRTAATAIMLLASVGLTLWCYKVATRWIGSDR